MHICSQSVCPVQSVHLSCYVTTDPLHRSAGPPVSANDGDLWTHVCAVYWSHVLWMVQTPSAAAKEQNGQGTVGSIDSGFD